jgi:nucleoside-diphosphate-sugar epimerase
VSAYPDRLVNPPTRILVTGASGFLGANLCRRMADLGVEIHGISRTEQAAKDVQWHRADASDGTVLEGLVREIAPDVVYHLASRVTGSAELAEVRLTLEANVRTALAVFEAAVGSGCHRVVTTGSDKELGVNGGAPGSPYAASKLAITGYARMFHQTFGLSVVNLRVFMVYGAGQQDPTKLVPYTIRSLLSGVAPELSGGFRRFDWIYVDDVTDALINAGTTGAGDDGVPIDIGSGELTSIRELVSLIARAVGSDVSPRYGAVPERPPEPAYPADLESAQRLLNWGPQTPLAAGVDAAVAWYRAHMGRSSLVSGHLGDERQSIGCEGE